MGKYQTLNLHATITKALDGLVGKKFTESELVAAFKSAGFNQLQAAFACNEVWMTGAVKWRKGVGSVA